MNEKLEDVKRALDERNIKKYEITSLNDGKVFVLDIPMSDRTIGKFIVRVIFDLVCIVILVDSFITGNAEKDKS